MTEEQVSGGAEAVTNTETVVVGKTKAKTKVVATGNLIADIAAEVEVLTKAKALSMADLLAGSIEENYFKLGGVLKLIAENSWFEGYADFNTFVFEKYGFQSRKARYLMDIYTDLVTKQIPWEKVQCLGWTKLKDLCSVLDATNVDEWVAKVKDLTYLEMMAVLKASSTSTGSTSTTTTDDVITLKFKLKADQAEVVQAGLAKCKGEINTDYDTVALENICAGYVAGTINAAGKTDIHAVFKEAGWELVLQVFSEVFPEIDLSVKVPS